MIIFQSKTIYHDAEERIYKLEDKTLEIFHSDLKKKKKLEKLKIVLEIYGILSNDPIYRLQECMKV